MRFGFANLVQKVLMIKEDGLASFGVPCSSFVWLNSATSKRAKDSPYGDCSKKYIRVANMSQSEFCYAINDMNMISQIYYVGQGWRFGH